MTAAGNWVSKSNSMPGPWALLFTRVIYTGSTAEFFASTEKKNFFQVTDFPDPPSSTSTLTIIKHIFKSPITSPLHHVVSNNSPVCSGHRLCQVGTCCYCNRSRKLHRTNPVQPPPVRVGYLGHRCVPIYSGLSECTGIRQVDCRVQIDNLRPKLAPCKPVRCPMTTSYEKKKHIQRTACECLNWDKTHHSESIH